MKKYLMMIACFAFLSTAFTASARDVSEKVLRSFKETFPNAQNVSWQSLTEKYVANFQQMGIRVIVNYDMEGKILSATRYYTEENLPINIICKLKGKYPSKKIYGVTEESTDGNVDYYVKLEDETTWVTVKCDTEGNTEVVEKYKKQM
jgi:hypothetical protein